MEHKEWIERGILWFEKRGWKPFPFQMNAWKAYLQGQNGLVNAPTGSGKTYSLVVPILLQALQRQQTHSKQKEKGIKAIWITPIRALAKEIHQSTARAIEGLGLGWEVAIRSGDTSSSDRQKQKRNPPDFLITTPESLHLILATNGYSDLLQYLQVIVADEWHELMGSKRGVQMELAISRLRGLLPELRVWGISATIGNMEESLQVLMGMEIYEKGDYTIIKSGIKKQIEVASVLPDEVERFPWAGHLGIKLLEKVIPILQNSSSTLIFTNTRAQCEIWYQNIIEVAPELIGLVAMHHGSISRELRNWVEDSLHEGKIKAVVCTSSLDLGVDFRPVETIVQIGSPKGVARFVQRAGRSGHQPGAKSTIYFVPTHSLELLEGAALRTAIENQQIEKRIPYIRSFDVLIQYLVTLSVSEGFYPEEIYDEIRQTFSYHSISLEEWGWILGFITSGGALEAYDEYKKVAIDKAGKFRILNKRLAQRHRLSMGTIVGDASLQVKYISGKKIGTIEEWFIAQLKPGDIFWFAGRGLELVRIKDMTVQVRKSKEKTGKVPAWMGGRIQLSSQLSDELRAQLEALAIGESIHPEVKILAPIAKVQQARSILPQRDEFLIEYFKSKEGYHLLMYPFEGRFVHEGMGALIAYRISRIRSISFSIAMNDYGFELLSEDEIPIEEVLESDCFSLHNLGLDIQSSINEVEMARRRFRDIASIAGLVFKGFPGQPKKERHLQSSSSLLFDVFHDHEPENLLFLQAYEEVRQFQLEETRLRAVLKRIKDQKIVLTRPAKATPLAFPIMVDRLREKMSSEKLEDRIKKMTLMLER